MRSPRPALSSEPHKLSDQFSVHHMTFKQGINSAVCYLDWITECVAVYSLGTLVLQEEKVYT